MQKWTLIAGIMTVALFGAASAATQTEVLGTDTAIVAPAKADASTADQSLARRCHGRGSRRAGRRCC